VIVVDSSAVIALLLDEPDSRQYEEALSSDARCVMSAFTHFETSTVLMGRSGAAMVADFDRLVELQIEVVPYDAEYAKRSRDAYAKFGKGYHPAALNLGDCVSYALAKSLDAPLLFKGADFALTDVRRAVG
jgi:ribonuclease VapC